ncbi:MAG: hypothetical protein J6127_06060 [Clostridiales bacterium]|nr:hypothetical protein [Clostridiales bacterium]
MRRRSLAFLLIIALVVSCFCMAGCNTVENEFPELDFESYEESMEPSESSEDAALTGDLHEITVALPLSDHTVNLLMNLYYAKANGLFADDMTGSDISIEYLEAINTPWIVNTITTANTGATCENLESLQSEGSMPDVFLANDIDEVASDELALPLDPYLSEYTEVNSSSVYLGAVEALRDGNEHYGIPFYTTVYMLAGNRDFLPESGVPAFTMSVTELLDHIRDIDGYSSEEGTSITRFYDAQTMSGLVSEDFIEDLEDEQLSSSTDAFGADPRLSRTCGMWLINSSEFDTWNTYYPDGLYFVMLPTERVNAVVYPVCVSASSDDADFATGFATFICFDKDAQMLIRRLEALRGFFPSISNQGVWVQMSDDEYFGSQSMLYEQFMNTADYVAAQE